MIMTNLVLILILIATTTTTTRTCNYIMVVLTIFPVGSASLAMVLTVRP
jgi:hypothetical protein